MKCVMKRRVASFENLLREKLTEMAKTFLEELHCS
jgi:hypothetical protein